MNTAQIIDLAKAKLSSTKAKPSEFDTAKTIRAQARKAYYRLIGLAIGFGSVGIVAYFTYAHFTATPWYAFWS